MTDHISVASKVRAAIRAHRGPVYVGMILRDDVIFVQAVKADLLDRLASLTDDDEQVSCFVRKGDLFVTNA
jgi:hypothetical protein